MGLKKRTRAWAVVLLLGLVLTACSSSPDSSGTDVADVPAVESPQSEDSSSATSVDDSQDTEAQTPGLATVEQPAPEVTVETSQETSTPPPTGIFAGASEALEALSSYRFSTSFLFTGEEDGEIESGSIELSGAIMDESRKHFVWRDLSDGEEFEIIQLEDQAWIYQDGEWEEVPAMVADAMSQAVLIFAPSVVWGGFFGGLETEASYVGRDTLDGVPALHYTSTYRQWAGYWQGELLDASGDVWIAEAGYPLRYSFSATGIDESGNQGSVAWTMQLSDVGADIVIEPPL